MPKTNYTFRIDGKITHDPVSVLNAWSSHFKQLSASGFVKKVSYSDSIFSSYEAVARFMHDRETAYVCFYDLQKALDTVQYPVLLERAHECGIVGRAWRLLKSWYTSPKCVVKIIRFFFSTLRSATRLSHPLSDENQPSSDSIRTRKARSLPWQSVCMGICPC